MAKPYHQAPLPFIGQKRNFIKCFRQLLTDHIPNNGESWTIVDVFGGSGLLAHNAKHLKPKAHMIYNDFDGYSERLQNIDDINRMRRLLESLLSTHKHGMAIDPNTKQSIIQSINSFDGYIDIQSLATWLLFSGKQVKTLDELYKHKWYHSVRRSDYKTADGYLDGIEVVSESYTQLMPKYHNKPNTLFLLDPPYLHTKQGSYKQDKYFAMVDFLYLMSLTRPPYIFFSSTKSELLDYMEYLKKLDSEDWQRVGGFEKVSIRAHLNHNVSYEDNMIYKFS